MAKKRRKKKPCSITFHLPKEDITLNFEYYEFIRPENRQAKYGYIYFENSKDIMSTAYEKWHHMVFKYALEHKPQYRPQPCDATVKIYDEESPDIIKEVFRLTKVLPERSMTGPLNDKKPKEKVVEYVDYKYYDKIAIEENIQNNDNNEEIESNIGDSGNGSVDTACTGSAE